MNKFITYILSLLVIATLFIFLGIEINRNTAESQESSSPMDTTASTASTTSVSSTTTITTTTSMSTTTPATSTSPIGQRVDATFFKCAANMTFTLSIVRTEGSSSQNKSLVSQPHTFASITIGGRTNQLLIAQSTSSPHVFESKNASLYVEGDEASLTIGNEVFKNCVATAR